MNLLFITQRLSGTPMNGTEVYCRDLIREMAKRHNISVIVEEGEPVSFTPEVFLRTGYMNDEEELCELLAENISLPDFDVVYNLGCRAYETQIAMLLRSLDEEFPLVNHFLALLGTYARHEGLDQDIQEYNMSGQLAVAPEAILNIFLSHAELEAAYGSGFDLENSLNRIIPAGVNEANFQDIEPDPGCLPPRYLQPGKRPLIIAAAGRFVDYVKGADLIYRAFQYLYQHNPDVFLVVVSDSDRFSPILDSIPPDAYRILEWLPQKEFLRVLAAADIVVVPSRYEAFGLVAVEAMMLEKPVIATAAGGLQEIVNHGKTGLLTEPGDGSFGLYQALRTLADAPALRAEMGKSGLSRARKKFGVAAIAGLIEQNLERALLGHRSLAKSPFAAMLP